MTYYGIEHDGTGYRIYATDNGVAKRLIGPRWASPRQAMAYADLQANLDRVSPLPTSSRAAEVGIASPPPGATHEEPQPSGSRPDVAATSHSASRTG